MIARPEVEAETEQHKRLQLLTPYILTTHYDCYSPSPDDLKNGRLNHALIHHDGRHFSSLFALETMSLGQWRCGCSVLKAGEEVVCYE